MNIRISLLRSAITGTLVAFAAASASAAAQDSTTMSVDARAPLHATLLPTVSVIADSTNPDAMITSRVDTSAALPVTLMPTVYVTARSQKLAVTVLPTVRVFAQVEASTSEPIAYAGAEPDATHLSLIEDEAAARDETKPLRARVMPR